MQDDTPRLPWSMPPASPQADTLNEKKAPAAPPGVASTFPSNNKAYTTKAPLYAAFLVVGILIGALLATGWEAFKQPAASASQQAVANTAAVAQTTPTNPALVVDDQPAGQSATIKGLNIAKPTWVVVYVSREGKPGNALGARLYFPRDKKGSVGLLRNTEPGQTYIVGLSVDNGDHVFSLAADHPLPDADGGPLWATFRAQ